MPPASARERALAPAFAAPQAGHDAPLRRPASGPRRPPASPRATADPLTLWRRDQSAAPARIHATRERLPDEHPTLVAHDRSFALTRRGGIALVTQREDGSAAREHLSLYRRAGAGDWRLESTLRAPPFGAEGLSEHHLHVARLGFGERLALSECYGITGGQHLAYLLERDGGTWRPACALALRSLLRDWRADEPFSHVAIEGSRAVVGVGRDRAKAAGVKNATVEPYENGVGAAYVLDRDAAGA